MVRPTLERPTNQLNSKRLKMSLNRHPKTRRRNVRQFVKNLLLGDQVPTDPKRGRLLLESLENRQLLAGDVELLFTEGVAADQATGQPSVVSASTTSDSTTSGLQIAGQAEGESAPDLVQFAKDFGRLLERNSTEPPGAPSVPTRNSCLTTEGTSFRSLRSPIPTAP